MKRPQDFDKLTDEDLEQIANFERQVEDWLGDSRHETYMLNTIASSDELRAVPRRVWEELVRRAERAGWRASFRGAIVEISRP